MHDGYYSAAAVGFVENLDAMTMFAALAWSLAALVVRRARNSDVRELGRCAYAGNRWPSRGE